MKKPDKKPANKPASSKAAGAGPALAAHAKDARSKGATGQNKAATKKGG